MPVVTTALIAVIVGIIVTIIVIIIIVVYAFDTFGEHAAIGNIDALDLDASAIAQRPA